MKGPSGRGRFQIRRRWLCKTCGRARETAGSVTFLICDQCVVVEGQAAQWMELIEEPCKLAPMAPPASSDQPQ